MGWTAAQLTPCSGLKAFSTPHCSPGFLVWSRNCGWPTTAPAPIAGLYQWDDPALAQDYARALWRVLALVSVPESIHYHVIAGLTRDQLLSDPGSFGKSQEPEWWRLVQAENKPA